MELEEDSNEPKYWFTEYKMGQIEKLHDYLNSLEETGKVLSFATILKIGREINNGDSLDSVQLGLMYEKLSKNYKEITSEAEATPEVVQCYSTTGRGSHKLIVSTKNSISLEELLRKIQRWPGVTRTETQIILSSYKEGAKIPVN